MEQVVSAQFLSFSSIRKSIHLMSVASRLPITENLRTGKYSVVLGTCCVLGGCLSALSIGCGGPVAFAPNRLQAAIVSEEIGEPLGGSVDEVRKVVVELFGTPDEPKSPTDFLDEELLKRAAGPVYSDKAGLHFGLYREHCVQCHDLSGQGRGAAAALQTPYPRDFTAGVFKYKSTPRGEAPTRDDLLATLRRGLPGSSMPSFKLVEDKDLEALVEYVAYLSMRGEVERRLLKLAGEVPDWANDPQRAEWIAEEVAEVIEAWSTAEEKVVAVSEPISRENIDLAAKIESGRELFHGPVANCVSCHGPNGGGLKKPLIDYDDWTKGWTVRMGIDPKDRDKLATYLAAGGLKPKPIAIRKLSNGAFRGGDSPDVIYLRLIHGIEGSPMPAVNLIDQLPSDGSPAAGLTQDQIWDLVWYVKSLGPESPGTQSLVKTNASERSQEEVGAE